MSERTLAASALQVLRRLATRVSVYQVTNSAVGHRRSAPTLLGAHSSNPAAVTSAEGDSRRPATMARFPDAGGASRLAVTPRDLFRAGRRLNHLLQCGNRVYDL
jgi:hypothetical protein